MSPPAPGPGPSPGGQPDEQLREVLDDERRRAEERVRALTREFEAIVAATADANTDDEHDPEGATIGFERAQVAALREQARARLEELGAAERRLEDGTFGRCERCGVEIARERLLVRPGATRCRRCAD